jgi:hypothetical protein
MRRKNDLNGLWKSKLNNKKGVLQQELGFLILKTSATQESTHILVLKKEQLECMVRWYTENQDTHITQYRIANHVAFNALIYKP